jgi:ferritin-like metal-binding protein YciE
MDQDTLQECLVDQLRDIYDAEKQLVKALPKMAKQCESEELAEAITEHLQETEQQVKRLEQVFEALGVPAKSKPCKGMKGLIEEGSEHAEEDEASVARDLAIIAAAQRVEHYEISAYGTARTMAEQLGNTEAAQLLEETEEEEFAADSKLSEIAMELYEQLDQEDSGEEIAEEEGEDTTTTRKQPSSQSAKASRGKAAR